MSTAYCHGCDKHWDLADGTQAGRCGECQGIVFRETAGPMVLLVIADENMCLQAGQLLLQAEFAVVAAHNEKKIFQLLEQRPVLVMILDVALPDMLAIELLEQFRQRKLQEAVKVLLLTSAYSKVAYKRPPTALYGADAWLEGQWLQEQLVHKVKELLRLAEQSSGRGDLSSFDQPLAEQLRQLALVQSIAADIAMTHPQAVLQWGQGHTGTPALKQAIADGGALLQTMAGGSMEQHAVISALQALVERVQQRHPSST